VGNYIYTKVYIRLRIVLQSWCGCFSVAVKMDLTYGDEMGGLFRRRRLDCLDLVLVFVGDLCLMMEGGFFVNMRHQGNE
jgi:hypothetical protein